MKMGPTSPASSLVTPPREVAPIPEAVNSGQTVARLYGCARQWRVVRMPCWIQLSNIDSEASPIS